MPREPPWLAEEAAAKRVKLTQNAAVTIIVHPAKRINIATAALLAASDVSWRA
jgi:hypothetical protein